MVGSRDYKNSHLKRLWGLSENECYNPDCQNKVIEENTVIGIISHIEAANEGGPRYNDLMTNDQRRDYKNLIVLCGECHPKVDNKENEKLYTVGLLNEWKLSQEKRGMNLALTNPSILWEVINKLSEIDFPELPENASRTSFSITGKIEHNGVKRWREIFNEYKVHLVKLNAIYEEIEKHGSNKRTKLMLNIRQMYLKELGKYNYTASTKIEVIRENADKIIDGIESECYNLLENGTKLYLEERSVGMYIVLVDAFINCKILEEPIKV